MRTGHLLLILTLFASACASIPAPATPAPLYATATLPSTAPPEPTSAPPPATLVPTTVPIPGITSSRLNVRGEPSSASPPLGLIEPFTTVQITGKDPGGNWYAIQYAQAKNGVGWVTAQYVNAQNAAAVPVVSVADSGPSGVITQQVNVRGGPGTDANSLGTLNARDVVVLLGKDSSGLWLQIQYPPGAEASGWVTAGYIQAAGLDQLPIVGQAGQLIGTETPTGIAPTAVPTPGVASQDNDSAQAPAADVTLSPTGVGSFIYSSDLSAPVGDSEDWIKFVPYSAVVRIRLDCTGSPDLSLDLTASGTPQPDQDLIRCGATSMLRLSSSQSYLLRLFLNSAQGKPQYVKYTLTIDSLP